MPLLTFVTTVLIGAQPADATPANVRPAPKVKVLMIVGGGYHDYDVAPLKLADNLGQLAPLDVTVSKDLKRLRAAELAEYDVLMIKGCLDARLTQDQQRDILQFIRSGNGLVAVHCALWSFQWWPAWRRVLGGLVLKHDPFGPFEVRVLDQGHAIAAGEPARFTITDELYHVDEWQPGSRVLAAARSKDATRRTPDPIAWTRRLGAGRVYCNTLGHDDKALDDPHFLRLMARGVLWSAGRFTEPDADDSPATRR